VALQLRICPPDLLAERDQSVAVTMGSGDFIEKSSDTQAYERLSSGAMNITQVRHGTVRVCECGETLRPRFGGVLMGISAFGIDPGSP
jgi:hypothetical protein